MAMASAAPKSIFSSEPWPPIVSATGRASVSTLVMLAERVHAARCQNWRACVLARCWVNLDPVGIGHPRRTGPGSAVTRGTRRRCCRAGRPRSAASWPCCRSPGRRAGIPTAGRCRPTCRRRRSGSSRSGPARAGWRRGRRTTARCRPGGAKRRRGSSAGENISGHHSAKPCSPTKGTNTAGSSGSRVNPS